MKCRWAEKHKRQTSVCSSGLGSSVCPQQEPAPGCATGALNNHHQQFELLVGFPGPRKASNPCGPPEDPLLPQGPSPQHISSQGPGTSYSKLFGAVELVQQGGPRRSAVTRRQHNAAPCQQQLLAVPHACLCMCSQLHTGCHLP